MRIIVATARQSELKAFLEALAASGHEVEPAQSGRECLDRIASAAPSLAVIDQGLPDMEPLALVNAILRINAMVNTAILSPLAPEEFHEWSEGLGVLCRLPMLPGEADAGELIGLARALGL